MHKSLKKVLVLLEASRAYDRGILRGIAKYSRTHGPWEFYQNTVIYRKNIIQLENISNLMSLKPDGIIMREPRNLDQVRSLGIPTIICPYTKEVIEGIPNIITDCENIGRLAARHLIEKGFKNFGFCGFDEFSWSLDRGNSFARFINDSGYEVNFYKQSLSSANEPYTISDERMEIAGWLESLPKPVAVMTCNDDRSQHVSEACKLARIQVPEQVAILGIDNDEMVCELAAQPLSSVELNSLKGGYQAAALLDEFMNGNTGPQAQRIVIEPTRVVTRRSTDIIALDDPDVANALKFIRDSAKNPLQVGDVAEATATAKRSLQRKFKQQLGTSIHHQIRNARIEEIKKMLIETQLTASQIAIKLNFISLDHLSRFFRQQTNSSISDFRKKHKLL